MNQRQKRRWVLGRLYDWFTKLSPQAGVGPIITLSSLVAAIVAFKVTSNHYEADIYARQLAKDRDSYELLLSEIQIDIEKRIPDKVSSPLPIFPENGQTLVLKSAGEGTLELEWADRDRKHGHKYLVELGCIANIPEHEVSKRLSGEPRCHADVLDGKQKLIWAQRGMDRVKVPIKGAGTYAWRVARGEFDESNGRITVFEEWSPYYIFTVFESITQRVGIMQEVLVGVVGGRELLRQKEKEMVDLVQKERFDKKPRQYLSYATHEAVLDAVVRGELDYAIGGLTRARYREERGIFFTRGYADALPIFISKSSRTRPPQYGDTIGVLPGSINERALAHLEQSIKFVIVRESSLADLEHDLRNGSVDFIFTDGHPFAPLAPGSDSTVQGEFAKFGTLYTKLRDFYNDELSYSAMHSIATADQELCEHLDKLIEENSQHPTYDDVMRRIKTIYLEEGKTFLNLSLYFRFVDEFSHGAERACVKQ